MEVYTCIIGEFGKVINVKFPNSSFVFALTTRKNLEIRGVVLRNCMELLAIDEDNTRFTISLFLDRNEACNALISLLEATERPREQNIIWNVAEYNSRMR